MKLSNGNWAEVRTVLTVGDVKYQMMEAQSRGFQNETLDSLALIDRLVEKWSFGDEVTKDAVDALDVADALAIVSAINTVMSDPNPSSPSSGGIDEGESAMPADLPASGS